MRWAFSLTHQEVIERGDKDPHRLALLPSICCQAAGGEPQWADEFAAAWLLFYTAAHLLDKIEDQDPTEPWWEDLGTGAVLNVAIGYCFCASQVINGLYQKKEIEESVEDIVDGIYDELLVMCSGQHRDLIHPEPNLEQYWKTTGAKSGAFFKLACRSGARLGTGNERKLAGYSQYGHHFGILVQILDDLEEFERLMNSKGVSQSTGIGRSLPVAYALEHLPRDSSTRLWEYINGGAESAEPVFDLIDQSGAGFYLSLEIQRHREAAMNGLEQAAPIAPLGEILISMLPDI